MLFLDEPPAKELRVPLKLDKNIVQMENIKLSSNKKRTDVKPDAKEKLIETQTNQSFNAIDKALTSNQTLINEVLKMKNTIAEKDKMLLEAANKNHQLVLKNFIMKSELIKKDSLIESLHSESKLKTYKEESFDLLGFEDDHLNNYNDQILPHDSKSITGPSVQNTSIENKPIGDKKYFGTK